MRYLSSSVDEPSEIYRDLHLMMKPISRSPLRCIGETSKISSDRHLMSSQLGFLCEVNLALGTFPPKTRKNRKSEKNHRFA